MKLNIKEYINQTAIKGTYIVGIFSLLLVYLVGTGIANARLMQVPCIWVTVVFAIVFFITADDWKKQSGLYHVTTFITLLRQKYNKPEVK